MRSASFAEWILSLVAPPDRAASTTGDLVEEASTRGVPWFWSSVLRTAASHVWCDLTASPLKTVGLAFWGWLANWVIGALIAAVFALAPAMFLPRMGYDYAIPYWFYPVLEVVACTAVPVLAGWMVARRSNGRELAAIFAVAMLSVTFYLIRLCYSAFIWPLPGMEHALAESLATMLFMAAGAILFRRRAIKG